MNSASLIARTLTEIRHLQIPRCFAAAIPLVLALTPSFALAQAPVATGLLVSREELVAAASRAEIAAKGPDRNDQARSAILGSEIRRRLETGDFQIGDRVVVSFVSDAVHTDTVVVRSGPSLELPGSIVVPLAGVLRSELHGRVSTELLKYVKARQIEVTPLMRVGVMGSIARPGSFAFPSDLPLTDVIMAAGGPTGATDLDRMTVRRGKDEFKSADETREALARGLTLDQFGLKAGDELVIGERRNTNVLGMASAGASILAVLLAIGRR
jgi:hypothetical protein